MISTHVLDTARGCPARAVTVHLDVLEEEGAGPERWTRLATAVTNKDGRASDLTDAKSLRGRTCRLSFETAAYFAVDARPTFFPRVDVIFDLAADADRYHIPLLLSSFGYSTYRGS